MMVLLGILLILGISLNLWGFIGDNDNGAIFWICLNIWLMLLVGIIMWG